jgi:eukaryotic-like serine/threonine-protein kinase
MSRLGALAERWRDIDALLDEALELAPARRDAWLDALPAEHAPLRDTLRRLLATQAAVESANFLGSLPGIARGSDAELAVAGIEPGAHVGPYRLIEELGRGGMGAVWLAERADGAFTRQVALKLPLLSGLRPELAARFERERDILARLEHPNIARFYDAGVRADGLPYLAMERVQGRPIGAWCDERRLDIAARLRLFAQVLDAVQYAHARLVIHRDLKPANILVTDSGDVRLLDFGIAKLLSDDQRTLDTQLTQTSGRALTPDYASPEQIKGEPLTIASDVYSLGVVLFELLAGGKPYRVALASLAQLEQAIVASEALRPSGAIDAHAAARRGMALARARRALRSDLDAIVGKALAKQTVDRYQTVAEFARDLERHRDGMPIMATAPSGWDRARRFVSRHRLAVGAAASVSVLVLGAAGVALQQAETAREQAGAAQREARRATAVQDFVLDLFRANSDRQADPRKARSTTARELLDIGAQRIETALADEHDVKERMLRTLADMYNDMALSERAVQLDEQRLEILRRIRGPQHPEVADALIDLASRVFETPRKPEALPLLEQARRIVDDAGGAGRPLLGKLLTRLAIVYQDISYDQARDTADAAVQALRADVVRDHMELGLALMLAGRQRNAQGDPALAEPLFAEAIAVLRQDNRMPQRALTQHMRSLAESQLLQFKLDDAERTYREAIALAHERQGELSFDAYWGESRLAWLLHRMGRRDEARRLHSAALDKALRDEPNVGSAFLEQVRNNYGRSLLAEGRLAAALPLLELAAESSRANRPGAALLGHRLRDLGALQVALGRYDAARQSFDEGLALWQRGSGAARASASNVFHLDAARLDLAIGDATAAIKRLQAVAAPMNAERLPIRADELQRDLLLAQARLQLREMPQALALTSAAHAQLTASSLRDRMPALEADALWLLGQAHAAAGASGVARGHLERAVAIRNAIDDDSSPWLAQVQIALANVLVDLGELPTARQWMNKAAAAQAAHSELAPHLRRPLAELRRRLASQTPARQPA